MGTVRIVTDSCACIPAPLVEAHDIIVVPYYVHIGEQTYRDHVDLQLEPFLEYMSRASELPKSANPGPGDYLAAFRQAAGATDVVSIHMTSTGSGAYQAGLVARDMARQELPGLNIEVVDTRNVAMCQGWIALEAAREAQKGADLARVMDLIRGLMPRVRMIQTADTLRYLYMGGRIGRAQHLVGSLLNVKPLISMEDGVIVALGQARSRPGAYRQMVDRTVAAVGRRGRAKVAYLHAGADAGVRELQWLLEARLTPVESLVAELPPALAVHTGPGTVGLCYLHLP